MIVDRITVLIKKGEQMSDFEFEDDIEVKADGIFSIGQIYEDEPAKTVYCSHCGKNEFYVGSGSYFTAIKCISCKREVCIHDG